MLRFGLLTLVLAACVSAQTVIRSERGARESTRRSRTIYKDVAGTFHGKLKDLSDKFIMIETEGHNLISMRRSRKTKFLRGDRSIKASDIDLDTPVTVDAMQEASFRLTAIRVFVGQVPRNGAGN